MRPAVHCVAARWSHAAAHEQSPKADGTLVVAPQSACKLCIGSRDERLQQSCHCPVLPCVPAIKNALIPVGTLSLQKQSWLLGLLLIMRTEHVVSHLAYTLAEYAVCCQVTT